ncbi:MAG TPA: oxygenase MpaB family protein [Thermodesulfobacteriota bacterium]
MRPDGAAFARTVNREVVLLAGWGRALLLQVAHPLVAEGVASHSGFLRDRRGRWARLRRTLDAMLTLTFGTDEEAARVAAGINAIHRRVNGRLPARAGPFPAGTAYSARDPRLLRWVHATFVDSILEAYAMFVRPLAPAERDRYCAEATRVEPLLDIPAGYLPRSAGELERYLTRTLESGEIAVTDTARALAREVLHPVRLPVIGALLAPARLPTVGLLPPAIREAYGLRWSAGQRTALRLMARAVRGILPVVPPALRYWPMSRRGGGDARQLRRPDSAAR